MGSRLPEFVQSASASADAVALWAKLCDDPVFASMPYKVETNFRGDIILMSPAQPRHWRYQATIAHWLFDLAKQNGLPGHPLTEAGVLTMDGVKVPDVAWAHAEQVRRAEADRLYREASALCVEVLSPSNTEAEMHDKMALYFAAGASEVWLCGETGEMRFFDPPEAQALPRSALFAAFPASAETMPAA